MLQFCPHCGGKRTAGGKYCPNCGALIGLLQQKDISSQSTATQNSDSSKELLKKGFKWQDLDWNWVIISVILIFFIGQIMTQIFPPLLGLVIAGFVCGYIVGYGSHGETIYEAAVGIAIGTLLWFILMGWRGEEIILALINVALYSLPSIAGAVIGEKQQKKKLMKKKTY